MIWQGCTWGGQGPGHRLRQSGVLRNNLGPANSEEINKYAKIRPPQFSERSGKVGNRGSVKGSKEEF